MKTNKSKPDWQAKPPPSICRGGAGPTLLGFAGFSRSGFRPLAPYFAGAVFLDCLLEITALRRHSQLKCPFCAHLDDKVIDSREGRSGDTIRRRRECLKCSRRFTTYERIDEIPYMVIKKDGRRERFERQKILQGLLKACEKRPVPTPKLESIVDEIEGVVHEATERELTTTEIGEMIMHRLKKLDKVAYVRFASVYMDFKDVQEFMSELKNLLKDRALPKK